MVSQTIKAVVEGSGILGLLLPFILVFTIMYGLLARLQLFGDSHTSKRVNLTMSGAVALGSLFLLHKQNFLDVWTSSVALIGVGGVLFLILINFAFGSHNTRIGKAVFTIFFAGIALWALDRLGIFSLSIIPEGVAIVLAGLATFVIIIFFLLRTPKKDTPEEKPK